MTSKYNTKKYHASAPMGRNIIAGTTVENKGKLILSKYKHIVCALNNYYLNPREKFEPGPGFEPHTSRYLAWRFTTWAILVQLTVQVKI